MQVIEPSIAQVVHPLAPRIAIQPVILAGGSGTRLWPLSREKMPKPLIPGLVDDTTLLCATVSRLAGINVHGSQLAPESIVVCGEAHAEVAATLLRDGGHHSRLLLEPCPRNTAPALTAAALDVASKDPSAVIVAMPADHFVDDTVAFQRAIAIVREHEIRWMREHGN